MITKEEACNRIKEKGFKAQLIDGVINITPGEGQAINEFRKQVQSAISEIGYKASWGMIYGQAAAPKTEDPEICPEDTDTDSEEKEPDPASPVTIKEEPEEEPDDTEDFFTQPGTKDNGTAHKTGQLTFFDETGQLTLF